MSNVYISTDANLLLKKHLSSVGHNVIEVMPMTTIDKAIQSHPDIYMCVLGASLYHGDVALLGYEYPQCAIFNGCSTGKYFMHNLKYTAAGLLKAVRKEGQVEVHVPQGYTKCNCVVVDEDSIITSDHGIYKSVSAAGINVLLIEKGQVVLKGHPYGFLGGASGKIGNTIIFNGDITKHSDYNAIKSFIESRKVDIKYFEEYQLTDIGSIIEEKVK